MRRRRKNNLIIGLLFSMLLFMGVGYGLLSQNLNIVATTQSTGKWQVVITNIESEKKGTASVESTDLDESKTIATLKTKLIQPTDKVTYTITVMNKGTIDAVRENITEDSLEKDVSFKVNGKEFCYRLKAGQSCQYEVVIEYLETGNGQELPEEGTIIKNTFEATYIQETNEIVTPDGEGGEIQEQPDYTLDEFGTIIAYNPERVKYDSNGYLVVPAVNEEGKQIKATSHMSFARNVIEFVSDSDGNPIAVIKEKENIEELKNDVIENVGYDVIMTESEFLEYLEENSLTYTLDFVTSVVIENDIREMVFDEYLFYKTIEKIDFSNAINLTEIGDYTLNSLYKGNLKAVKFGNLITKIGEGAFNNNQLSSISLPPNLTEIPQGAFASNEISGEIVIPSTVTTIGESAFVFNKISSIAFEGSEENSCSLKSIKSMAFYQNQISGNFMIPSSVNDIGYGILMNNPNLSTITIKRENSTGITLATDWNRKSELIEYYEVIYDKN